MLMKFATQDEQSDFVRRTRLLRDDLSSYAAAAGPYVAIQRCKRKFEIEAKLNLFPTFWHSTLASLQHTAIISLARIHDSGKSAYLRPFLKALERSASPEIKAAGKRLTTVIATHQAFIEKCVSLRNNLFAHTNHHAPLHATFGFDGLTVDMLESYWIDVAASAVDVEKSVSARSTGRKFVRVSSKMPATRPCGF